MSYQPFEKSIPKYFNGEKIWGKRDCKDFKPYFMDRKHCRLQNSCMANDYHCEGGNGILNRRDKLCTGIDINKWQKIIE